jgi:DeoR/GlpR family transcriptional regulator of sugar metabolism
MKVIESNNNYSKLLMLPSKDLYLEERRQEIIKRVEETGRVTVAELSQELGVSEVTIRTDLQALAEQKLLIRTHGGAIPSGNNLYELALVMRRERQVQEKSRIGQAAGAMILDGDAVFLDSSSTVLVMTQHLKNHRHLTIITNSLAVAQEMQDAAGVRVVMPGGSVQKETASLVGVDGLELLRQFNIQKGFFGAHGLSLPEGLTDVSAEVAEVKRALVSMCRQTIAVLDATKWGRVGLASFARPDEITTIITDAHAPVELVAQVRAVGITVNIV